MAQDSGLVKRGLVLLAVMVLIGATVMFIWFRSPSSSSTKELPAPEHLVMLVPVPLAPFPATLSWAVLFQLRESLPSDPGFDIRYTATRALARRGSPSIPLHNLAEMLNEDQQRRNFRVKLKDGRVVANQTDVQEILLASLRAVQEWHQHEAAVRAVGKDHPDLKKVYAAVDKLAGHDNQVLKNEARKVRLAIHPQ